MVAEEEEEGISSQGKRLDRPWRKQGFNNASHAKCLCGKELIPQVRVTLGKRDRGKTQETSKYLPHCSTSVSRLFRKNGDNVVCLDKVGDTDLLRSREELGALPPHQSVFEVLGERSVDGIANLLDRSVLLDDERLRQIRRFSSSLRVDAVESKPLPDSLPEVIKVETKLA